MWLNWECLEYCKAACTPARSRSAASARCCIMQYSCVLLSFALHAWFTNWNVYLKSIRLPTLCRTKMSCLKRSSYTEIQLEWILYSLRTSNEFRASVETLIKTLNPLDDQQLCIILNWQYSGNAVVVFRTERLCSLLKSLIHGTVQLVLIPCEMVWVEMATVVLEMVSFLTSLRLC